MRKPSLRRRIASPAILLVVTTNLLNVSADPAAGRVGTESYAREALSTLALTPAPTLEPGDLGDEGENPMIRDVLARAGREYTKAKAKLDASKERQLELDLRLRRADKRLAELSDEVSAVAAESYRTGRIGPVTMLLNSSSTDDFIERAQAMELLTIRDNAQLRDLKEARASAAEAKAAIDAETREQRKQLTVIAKQKKDAEKALEMVGGEATGGYVSATSPVARPAPRNRDGSWPKESCSEDDPTTSGCVTPRTLHALKETLRVGFTRHVSCYRSGGPYEHPKGRACDFSPEKNGFGGAAQGEDRVYGNNLAAFLVRNADRLGVLYVIWYKQIWFPATGWRAYRSAKGDPSSDHTNHIHLSLL